MDNQRTADWIYLPASSEEQSLWDCLHDAELWNVHSDALQRTARLEFEAAPYLGYEEGLRFAFTLTGVTSLRATKWQDWPGGFHAPKEASREERSRLIEDYKGKGREVTVTWKDFEDAFTSDRFDVMDAHLSSGDNQMALRLQGFLREDDEWCVLFLRGQSLNVTRSDSKEFSLQQFMTLGEAYWKRFSKKGRA